MYKDLTENTNGQPIVSAGFSDFTSGSVYWQTDGGHVVEVVPADSPEYAFLVVEYFGDDTDSDKWLEPVRVMYQANADDGAVIDLGDHLVTSGGNHNMRWALFK